MDATDTSSLGRVIRGPLRPRFCDVCGAIVRSTQSSPPTLLPLVVAALLTTAKAAKPTVYGDAKSAMRATLLLCHPSLLLGRRIGIILEFEKAELEPVIGEIWRRRLSAARAYCHVGIFRAWRPSRHDD